MRTLTFYDTKIKFYEDEGVVVTSSMSRLNYHNQERIVKKIDKLIGQINEVVRNHHCSGVAIKADEDQFDYTIGKKLSGNRCVDDAQSRMAKELAKASDQAYELYELLDMLTVSCKMNALNMALSTNAIIEETDEAKQ